MAEPSASEADDTQAKASQMKRLAGILLPTLPILILLAVWYCAVRFGWVAAFLLPSPVAVFSSLLIMIMDGSLWMHASASLVRVGIGFSLATLTAIPIGLLLGQFAIAGRAFGPLVELMRTISPISWIPLAILWFGIGDNPAIFILFMASVFPLIISTRNAVVQTDPILLRVAANMGASPLQTILNVTLPASIPYIFVGMRISLGICWVVVVAAEMAGLRSGLGYLILDGRNLLRSDIVIAGMIAIGLIGLVLDLAMTIAARQLARYGYLKVT